mmetsp:Transcript_1224/g.2173  ORF Transcript_1224/g.2173 Transcript_1224/m.2173 type:complete len:243 (-) Transcript_1224:189-917(-)|eukprot:CAMPEP_0183717416 /NCGR_PEP_ID=MMETSP0737-20130205/11034_1 /TAXON_ID=385413 /ORGANISM="Thalassiosira miniscula, Strain CCMP1093" /LENGTH=242 /DNA_ID=CAMNT_0025946859 /DNA_START=301 /DNA_END=1029 /DNA_ORIENTATION=-
MSEEKVQTERVFIYKEHLRLAVPKDVTKVIFDSSVTKIDGNTFRGCTKLKEVILNEGLKVIGPEAFYNCNSLREIELPSTVIEVGSLAFQFCTNLRQIILHERVEDFTGGYAFALCTQLQHINFPTVSKRIKCISSLAGRSRILNMIANHQHFSWNQDCDGLIVSIKAMSAKQWGTTRRNLDQVLARITYYELQEVTPIIALAFWKSKIEEDGAETNEEREACRIEVPGPVRSAILQYFVYF